jgi:enoyl-CoA hydratase
VIELTTRGNVAVLRMNHGKANAMDLEFCEALTAQFLDLRRSSPRSVVITGTGRMFSAGVDLLRVVDGGAAYVRVFLPAVSRTLGALFSLPMPVVAAVNGHAIAGGCVMACAADYRMMAREPGRIGIPELLVGVPFPVVPLEIMRFAAPPQHLQSLMYRGTTLSADAALQHGLVDAVVDPLGLVDEAVAVAERFAALSPAAFALTKRQLREPAQMRIRNAGPRIDPAIQLSWESPETIAAIRDYVARTLKKE